VLETFKNGSRRLLPITFFYEKHYYDATFYHATPVPFTLYSETVYEVEQFGKPLGTFTLQSATRNSNVWFGNGKYKVAPDAATLAKKAAPAPVVVEDPSRPVLHRREGSEGDNPAPHPTAAAARPEVEEDPDRPKLHRKEGSGDASAPNPTQASASAPAGTAPDATTPAAGSTQGNAQSAPSQPEETSGQDPNRPKLQRRDSSSTASSTSSSGSKSTTAPSTAPTTTPATTTPSTTTPSSTPSSTAPAGVPEANNAAGPVLVVKADLTPSEDPDHPILRRGKPVEAQGGRDLPDFKKEEPISRQIAVSDAGSSEVQPLIYLCSEGERQQIETSARDLAQAELRRVGVQRGLTLAGSPTKSATVSSRKKATAAAAKPPALPLTDEQFVPYDLDYNNYATVVYSARYAPEGAQNVNSKGKGWVVTVVARQDEGKLLKLYSAVSDPRELDLYPEVRLVDAVDPDGYGRMALLFREQKRDGVSWLIGRPTGYELQTVFKTPSR